MFDRAKLVLTVVTIGLMFAGSALADWDPGDGYKMHWPQLPDPNGWDVDFYASTELQDPFTGNPFPAFTWPSGDDWKCTASGPVTDIHFWVSMKGDTLQTNPNGVVPFQITNLQFRIRANVLSGEDNGGRTYEFSTPGVQLWSGTFSDAGQHQVRHWDTAAQGWYVPVTDEHFPADHDHIYQINIPDTSISGETPFEQVESEIYWLQIDYITAVLLDENGRPTDQSVDLGWKTARQEDRFLDVATYYYQEANPYGPSAQGHRRLIIDGEPRDFAFVIAPEPGAVAMLLLGGLALLRRRGKP